MSNKIKSKQGKIKERVYRFFSENKPKEKLFTVNPFRVKCIPKPILYDIIRRTENEYGPEIAVESG